MEARETTGTGSVKIVAGDFEVLRNRESVTAEAVHDESLDLVAFGDGYERLVEIRIAEAEELKSKCFMVGRGGRRESNVGEIVKDDRRDAGRDGGYVWTRGTSVVWLGGDEYVYSERTPVGEDQFGELDHGDEVANGWCRVQN